MTPRRRVRLDLRARFHLSIEVRAPEAPARAIAARFMAAWRLTGTEAVDGSARQRAPASPRVLFARVTTGVARLSIHCQKYGPESEALANGPYEETRSWTGHPTKRLMGLEPTTFCMASRRQIPDLR